MMLRLTLLVACLLGIHLKVAAGVQPPPGGAQTILLLDRHDEKENININFFDKSRLEVEYLSVLKARDQRDYEFLYASIENLHGGLRDLSLPVQQLQTMSDQSLTEGVAVQDFLGSVRSYEQAISLLKNQISTLALLPTLKIDAMKELSGKINFAPLQQHYLQQLAFLEQHIASNRFNLTLPSGAIHVQMGINTQSLKSMQLFSAEQLANMRKQANAKKMMKTEERNIIEQSINAFTRSALETFIDAFGTSERYRSSSDKEGQIKAAEALSDAFWARSYIRAVYGIKIGSVPVNYQKRLFNLDYLISNISIGAITFWDESHLEKARNLAVESQATAQYEGASSVLREFSTLISGSGAAEHVKKFVIDLIKRDLEQELTLGRRGGLKEVRSTYRQFYYATEAKMLHYQQMTQQIFGSPEEDDLEANVPVIESGTLRGVIAQCISVLEAMEERLEEARQIDNSLAIITSDYKTVNKRKKRADL